MIGSLPNRSRHATEMATDHADAIEQRPQAGREMFGCVLVAGDNIDIEDQPYASHRVGMIGMARPPGLLGVVANHRAFLMAVEWLHSRIDVEYPRLGKKRRTAIIEMPSQPHRAVIFVDRREGAPNGVLANDLVHAEKLWKNAYRNVTPLCEHNACAQTTSTASPFPTHRVFSARSGSCNARAIRHESVEQASRFQKIDEERQLPKRRQRRLGIPFDKHRAGETVEDHALRRAFAFNRRLLTRRVKGGIRKFVRHAPDNAVILAKYKPANCRL